MKYIVSFICVLCCTHSLVAQGDDRVSIRLGISDIDGTGYGYNIEVSYEKRLIKGLTLEGNLGLVHYDDFPDSFHPDPDSNPISWMVNGVPAEVSKEILADQSSSYFFKKYSSGYIQLCLKYYLPIKFLGVNFFPIVGLSLKKNQVTKFALRNHSGSSFTPYYGLHRALKSGYVVGIGFDKKLAEKYYIGINLKYDINFQNTSSDYAVGIFNLGVSKTF